MYFPKSQIQTSLYSGGELKILTTGQPYVGFYWATSNKKFYVGKNPDSELTLIELVKGGFDAASNSSELEPYIVGSETTSAYNFNTSTLDYLRLKGIKDVKAPRPPKYIFPTITKENYEVGELTRYFCKKNNESLFIEIDIMDFDLIANKSKEIQSNIYSTFTLPWVISGIKEEVALENKKSVEYRELNQKAYGLSQYLNHNYLQFYADTPGVKKINLNRVYQFTGDLIPNALPSSYQLGNVGNHKKQGCTNCYFNQNNICNKWSAPIKENYWCQSYKSSKGTTPQTELVSSTPSTPSSNIYTQNNTNLGGSTGY